MKTILIIFPEEPNLSEGVEQMILINGTLSIVFLVEDLEELDMLVEELMELGNEDFVVFPEENERDLD
ncbi:hypothetical protein Phi19:2_gp043 [Cellulophaga phage phi19:2]|uniref:Uncharacterized protein n=3 Tax=Cellulophaga phage phiST TaxID=756282 RepID=M4SK96_9CAUD|nr:hypothetical protein CGPG_00064 [Cellulophaga phage phiST]AGH56762.1 hypothetical protein CGPG_00064 [Cellulophaga phage phiST]AGO47182.1 hypothetical protein PhiST_gp043 [Cellulophaga phage phiST]AGO48678.1 hypothetical protein Phi19:2_gp043 [Cellulophaga phage phi19:2]AGO49048.1 hypothetical protein Phi13:1_gp037 [Cellulophaga phage phi13:1]